MEADERVIAALFAADRLDHLLNKTNGIIKKMEEGYTVITDRYYFSSYAYHSVHMPMEWVIETNSLSADLLRPDISIYIDMDPELSMKRLNSGRSTIELYETLDNLTLVRKKYMEAFELLKAREHVFITDGNQPVEAIAAAIWKEIANMAIHSNR
jgi:dTMP kinase